MIPPATPKDSPRGITSSARLALVIGLVLQNSLATILGRAGRTATALSSSSSSWQQSHLYSINHMVVMAELAKLLISLSLELISCNMSFYGLAKNIHQHIIQKPSDAIKGSLVPAALYFTSNMMSYVALSHLSAPVFQVLIQGKLVTTAIVSAWMLGRKYVFRQWVCLSTISLGVALVAISSSGGEDNNDGNSRNESDSSDSMNNMNVGVLAVIGTCVASAAAGVYFEKIVKTTSSRGGGNEISQQPSLWVRNMMLSFFSVLIGIIQGAFQDLYSQNPTREYLHGFTPMIWGQVLLLSCGGILAAAVMKHTDNVVKGLSTGISVVLTAIVNKLVLGASTTVSTVIGSGIVLVSVYFFFNQWVAGTLSRWPHLKMRRSTRRVVVALLTMVILSVDLMRQTQKELFSYSNGMDRLMGLSVQKNHIHTHNETLIRKQYRVLLTDILFPISFAKWRIEEIYSFIEEYYTDILIFREIYPRTRGFDILPTFDKCESRFMLSRRYDVLIFDPKWNVLNIFNTDEFDGTVYNGRVERASYMLRRKEFRNERELAWDGYDACYHIFLDLFRFNHLPIPYHKQWIHLYPGGGLFSAEDLTRIHPDVGIVVTQVPVLKWVQNLPNQIILALGGSFLQQDSVRMPKYPKKPLEKIGICFTSASGDALYKGDAIFEQAIRDFAASHPILWNKTTVYTVGNTNTINGLGIKSMGFMDQDELDEFYLKNIDIYINTETGMLLNGWPLGMEALLQGAVGIQTDSQGMNIGFNFTEEEMFIVPTQSAGVPHIVQSLVKLTNNTVLLHSMSKRSQKKLHNILAYSNSQAKVFRAINARIQASLLRAGHT